MCYLNFILTQLDRSCIQVTIRTHKMVMWKYGSENVTEGCSDLLEAESGTLNWHYTEKSVYGTISFHFANLRNF